jgi:hypothetical protein
VAPESQTCVVREIERREWQRRLAARACEAELARRETQRAICKEVETLERDRSKRDAREMEEEERSGLQRHGGLPQRTLHAEFTVEHGVAVLTRGSSLHAGPAVAPPRWRRIKLYCGGAEESTDLTLATAAKVASR